MQKKTASSGGWIVVIAALVVAAGAVSGWFHYPQSHPAPYLITKPYGIPGPMVTQTNPFGNTAVFNPDGTFKSIVRPSWPIPGYTMPGSLAARVTAPKVVLAPPAPPSPVQAWDPTQGRFVTQRTDPYFYKSTTPSSQHPVTWSELDARMLSGNVDAGSHEHSHGR